MDRAPAADPLTGHRLGFACLVPGKPKMKTYDGRRWQNNPHLRASIGLLRDTFAYLDAIDVRLFRLSLRTAPYITHPTLPQFWHQLDECRAELADLGALARRHDLRLSMHPGQYTLLNAALDGQHAEDIHAGEFAHYLASAPDRPFDIMLEAKAKDLALLKLRDNLKSLTPLLPAATRRS